MAELGGGAWVAGDGLGAMIDRGWVMLKSVNLFAWLLRVYPGMLGDYII